MKKPDQNTPIAEIVDALRDRLLESLTVARLRRLSHGPERDRPVSTVAEAAAEITPVLHPVEMEEIDLGDGERLIVDLSVRRKSELYDLVTDTLQRQVSADLDAMDIGLTPVELAPRRMMLATPWGPMDAEVDFEKGEIRPIKGAIRQEIVLPGARELVSADQLFQVPIRTLMTADIGPNPANERSSAITLPSGQKVRFSLDQIDDLGTVGARDREYTVQDPDDEETKREINHLVAKYMDGTRSAPLTPDEMLPVHTAPDGTKRFTSAASATVVVDGPPVVVHDNNLRGKHGACRVTGHRAQFTSDSSLVNCTRCRRLRRALTGLCVEPSCTTKVEFDGKRWPRCGPCRESKQTVMGDRWGMDL